MRENNKKNQSGLTLVEVLAGIVLISIIMLLFITVFSQFFSTTKKSEDIISATYVAQKEMEQIYDLSQTTSFNELDSKLSEHGYEKYKIENSWAFFRKKDTFDILVKIKTPEEVDLIPIVIEVFEPSTSKLEATMEHLLKWKE